MCRTTTVEVVCPYGHPLVGCDSRVVVELHRGAIVRMAGCEAHAEVMANDDGPLWDALDEYARDAQDVYYGPNEGEW